MLDVVGVVHCLVASGMFASDLWHESSVIAQLRNCNNMPHLEKYLGLWYYAGTRRR